MKQGVKYASKSTFTPHLDWIIHRGSRLSSQNFCWFLHMYFFTLSKVWVSMYLNCFINNKFSGWLVKRFGQWSMLLYLILDKYIEKGLILSYSSIIVTRLVANLEYPKKFNQTIRKVLELNGNILNHLVGLIIQRHDHSLWKWM